jgi:hypothetical protein
VPLEHQEQMVLLDQQGRRVLLEQVVCLEQVVLRVQQDRLAQRVLLEHQVYLEQAMVWVNYKIY